jgi:4-hydroxy-3-polyprenylbenzoate decarboxylase
MERAARAKAPVRASRLARQHADGADRPLNALRRDVGARIASGSCRTLGMVVAPCSMKTLAEIAHGTGGTLVARTADVMLKERRRLVLLARETPLTLTRIRNMLAVTEMGAIVAPPVPAFYARPQGLDEMVDHTLGRVLDLFDIDVGAVRRWTGPASGRSFDEAKPEDHPA